MRENCTSGLMRGSNGNGHSRPLLSTLLVPFHRKMHRNAHKLSKIHKNLQKMAVILSIPLSGQSQFEKTKPNLVGRAATLHN